MAMDNSITRDDIARITKVFYAEVRRDPLLGPIFNGKLGTTDEVWDPHIAKIGEFWASIFLKTRTYKGNPMAKHAGLEGITPVHFSHWLELFAEAGQKTLPEVKQEMFNKTAARIAKSLQMGLAFHYDQDDTQPNPFAEFGLQRPSVRAAKGLE